MAWPRYREHLALMPDAVYRVEPGPIRHLLQTAKNQFGGAYGWAKHRGFSDQAIDMVKSRLLS